MRHNVICILIMMISLLTVGCNLKSDVDKPTLPVVTPSDAIEETPESTHNITTQAPTLEKLSSKIGILLPEPSRYWKTHGLRMQRQLEKSRVQMITSILNGEEPETNYTETYYNGTSGIPTYFCETVIVTRENYRELLIDGGYYTEDELGQ